MSIRDQYVFITNKNEEMQCIGIRKGKFEGVVYKYYDDDVLNSLDEFGFTKKYNKPLIMNQTDC